MPALLQGLKSSQPDIRAGAAGILGRLAAEPGRVVPALAVALRDPEYSVRTEAAGALAAFGHAARAAVASLLDPKVGEPTDAQDFGEAVARIASDPGSLRQALHSEDSTVSSRAAYALARMPPPAAALLLEALESPRLAVRRASIAALRPADAGPAAAEPVARLLSDPDVELRVSALVFLLNLDQRAAGVLPKISAALGAPEPKVRAVALQALAAIAMTPAEISPVLPLLRDPDVEVRRAAALALARRPAGRESLVALLELVGQPDTAGHAAVALGALGLPEALAPLQGLLGGDDARLRRAAARGLASLGPRAAPAAEALGRALAADREGRCEYWIALLAIGRPAAQQAARARQALGEEAVASCEEIRVGRSRQH